jgi:4-amino-4-deoxy-L-arabinose transferase-like glycosyltransferase
MLFGLVPIVMFFVCSNKLTLEWQRFKPELFTRKLFITALAIRVVYVIFIYFYFIENTGEPHAYYAADEKFYQLMGESWRVYGYGEFRDWLRNYVAFSDSGYCWWLAIEYLIFGTHVLTARILKCVIDAFACVLIYNLAKRNFGEYAGRMAAIFCVFMPNLWYYCGVTLKETEMAFLVILFVERGDLALRAPRITFGNILLPALIIIVMFTFRTALAGVLVAAFVAALILSSEKQMQMWKKILYSTIFAGWLFMTVGVEIVEETQSLWERRSENQISGYQEKLERENANSFIQYASAATMAPLIFSIPISTMVQILHQETQMILNGANFIKNILSGFTIFALITLLTSGRWRKHVLPIATTAGYLVVIVFSVFAHSERFHFPVLALELMFAAYGVTLMKNKHKRWMVIWMCFVCVGVILWNWIKLRGRGFV